jgi:hypothetical protein
LVAQKKRDHRGVASDALSAGWLWDRRQFRLEVHSAERSRAEGARKGGDCVVTNDAADPCGIVMATLVSCVLRDRYLNEQQELQPVADKDEADSWISSR